MATQLAKANGSESALPLKPNLGKVMFEPYQINGLQLRNRMVFSPFVENQSAKDGTVNPAMAQTYLEMAREGVGAVVLESAYVARQGRSHPNQLGIAEERHIEGLSQLVRAIHAEGATVGIRLSHAGARTNELLCGEQPVGPSIINFGKDFDASREFDDGDVEEFILFFVHAAERAEEAGFDFIELNGAQQQLLDQCMSNRYNNRADEYGGPIERRMALASKVVKGIKSRIASTIPVGFLFSIQDKIEDGFSADDLRGMMKVLTSARTDFFHPQSIHVLNKFFDAEETLIELVSHWTRKPIIAEGNMKSPQILKEMLALNKAQVFCLDKQLFSRPNWYGFLQKKILPPQ